MLKLLLVVVLRPVLVPAAFRRLCVETLLIVNRDFDRYQPPSGGCVLKHPTGSKPYWRFPQPPSGGCVLKHTNLSYSDF